MAVIVISVSSLCATFASSVVRHRPYLFKFATHASCCATQAALTETGLAEDLHTIHEVTILSISLYVMGLGLGPLLVGPLSELYGRNIIYRTSYVLFFALTWPTAFPPDIGTCVVYPMWCSRSHRSGMQRRSLCSVSSPDYAEPHS